MDDLVSSQTRNEFEGDLKTAIVQAPLEKLRTERDLIRLLDFVKESGTKKDLAFVRRTLRDPQALVRLLLGGESISNSNTVGEVTLQQQHVLAWEWLTTFLGEPELIAAFDHLPPGDPATPDAAVVELAKRYAAAWRPQRFAQIDDDEGESE